MSMAEEIVEHGQLFAGGSMLVRTNDPEVERLYPLTQWIEHNRAVGGRVFRRTVIVVEDWTEVQ